MEVLALLQSCVNISIITITQNAAQLHTLAASFTELKTKLSGDIEKKTNQVGTCILH